MINNFKKIGQLTLEKNNYYNQSKKNKRKILLQYQAITPKALKDNKGNILLDGKTICLNFDLQHENFEFKLSNYDLSENNIDKFFAFRLNAPKDKKKFLMTNNIATFYSAVFKESLDYLNDKRENKKSEEWFKNNIKEEYDKFITGILSKFYKEALNGGVYILNYEKLKQDQKNYFNDIKKGLLSYKNKKKEKWEKFFNNVSALNKKKEVESLNNEIWGRLINKILFNKESTKVDKLPSVVLITFNNETILEVESEKYKDSYMNFCYYDLFEKFFIEKGKKERLCYVCGHKKDVIQEIPFPMKFYGTTNNLYFENLSNKNAYKSFAICKDCLFEVLTGMKIVENKFSDYLFDLSVYILPKDLNSLDEQRVYRKITKTLKKRKSGYKDDINQIKELLKKAKRETFFFDFMFYDSPAGSQEFNILKVISNVDTNILLEKLKTFDGISEKYGLNQISDNFGNNSSLSLNDLRYYLFPSRITDKNPDFRVYGKDLLNFLETFLTANKLSYIDLISRFVKIYKKRLIKDDVDTFSAFKMNLFLSIFLKSNQLKKGGNMNNGKIYTEILIEEYEKFFETHKEIYESNAYRQGLFLLGTVVSKIIYAQKEKNSNFLKKINFSGLSVRRVPALVNQVREYFEIYKKDIFEDKGVWGNITDRLQGIEESDLKPEEVIFYTLSGISFADYLGIKKGLDKKIKENTNGGER